MRGVPFPSSIPIASRGAVLLWVGLLLGCAGSAEFRSGEERGQVGDLRGAYRAYHQAYLLSGKRSHLEARNRVGSVIAESIRLAALARERAGEIDAAYASCLNAREYDPERLDLSVDLHRLEERKSRIDGAGAEAEAAAGSWEAYRLLRELRAEAVSRPGVFIKIGEAAEAAADREILALLGPQPDQGDGPPPLAGTAGVGLPPDAPRLETLLADWREFSLRLELVVLSDAEDQGAAGLEGRLAPRAAVAAAMAQVVADALSAERLRSVAALSEEAGNLDQALDAYQKAHLLWPYRPEIRDGLARASKLIEERASSGVLRAMARKEWPAALKELARLERLKSGSSEEVHRRAEICRSEIRQALLREGALFRDRGLPGNALCAFLRARPLGPPDPSLEREIAALENGIQRRFLGEVDVEFREVRSAGPEGALRESLSAAIGEAVKEGTFPREIIPGRPPSEGADSLPAAPRQALLLEVMDLGLDYRLERREAGTRESRFVTRFQEEENPEWTRIRRELGDAQAELDRARADLSAAPADKRPELATRVEIAEGRVLRAAAGLDQTPIHIPTPVWRKDLHPVNRVVMNAVLVLETRIDGVRRRLEARLSIEDREVMGDVEKCIAPDRPEIPPQGEAMSLLARKMAADLGKLVRERIGERRRQLLLEARERLAANAFEPCLENLVAFLYAGPASGDGTPFEEGVDLLRSLTGCEFPTSPTDPPAAALQAAKPAPEPPSRRF